MEKVQKVRGEWIQVHYNMTMKNFITLFFCFLFYSKSGFFFRGIIDIW